MNNKLIKKAIEVLGTYNLDTYSTNYAGKVASALITSKGNIYTGISLNLTCNVGNCAEHAAVLEMLKMRETHIIEIVAIYENKGIITPCGKCREMLVQLDSRNMETMVIVDKNTMVPLKELIPLHWIK